MRNFESPKQSVPQLNAETGLSSDYGNQFVGLMAQSESLSGEKFRDWLKELFASKGRIAERYEERFSSDRYDHVVTERNREAIARLDQIAQELNDDYAAGTLTAENVKRRSLEGMRLVLGEKKFTERFVPEK